MLNKIYYISFYDLEEYTPFTKFNMETFIKFLLGEESLTGYQVPSDISTNAVYNELLSCVMGKYWNHAFAKIIKNLNEELTEEDYEKALWQWGIKFISLLNDTYEYYTTLLGLYASAKDDLMADIKAISKNKVKFNDTPQNPNNDSVYEGDNYITHFTATEGENSSPLMTKIMRLKEIQDNYKDLMSIWVRDFERVFFQEEVNL